MIEHCPCGQLLPHARKPECEKPRVRLVDNASTADPTVPWARCMNCGADLSNWPTSAAAHRCLPINGGAE